MEDTQLVYILTNNRSHLSDEVNAYFVMHIPYLPEIVTSNLSVASHVYDEHARILARRQTLFLTTTLAGISALQTPDVRFSIEYRLIATPVQNSPNNIIHMFLVGKAQGASTDEATHNARHLASILSAAFPTEDPYNVPLRPIVEKDVLTEHMTDRVLASRRLIELAVRPLGQTIGSNVYVTNIVKNLIYSQTRKEKVFTPHSFCTEPDLSLFAKLYDILAQQNNAVTVVSFRLRPTMLTEIDEKHIAVNLNRWSSSKDMVAELGGWQTPELQKRIEEAQAFQRNLINNRNSLFRFAIQLVSDGADHVALAAAIGATLQGDKISHSSVWGMYDPETEDDRIVAYNNFQTLEFQSSSNIVHDVRDARINDLVTAREAATMFTLPVPLEGMRVSGVMVRQEPFVMPPIGANSVQKKEEPTLHIGSIIHRGQETDVAYDIALNSLTRHVMIAGTTGSGKTNTVFHLLRQLWKNHRIPWLVVEPAKTEYRKLLWTDELADVQVFTLGNETIAPFRLNPLEIPQGVLVQTHADYLKSAIMSAFEMYAPMPQLLEQAIVTVYENHGWDFATETNRRGIHPMSYPTLSDLHAQLTVIVANAGYSQELTANISAALLNRIHNLRIGGKGLMLDTRVSIDFEQIMSRPTILEVESIADDQQKAFVIGLLLVRLYEYYQAQGQQEGTPLKHVTVIEESHRLLANVAGTSRNDVANAAGHMVSMFANMLAEVRAYGEGIILVEQIPTKLAPDLIKNTKLRLLHGLSSPDDINVMASSMGLVDAEIARIPTLSAGEIIVHGEGDRSPNHVAAPYSKLQIAGNTLHNEIKHMKSSYGRYGITQQHRLKETNRRILQTALGQVEFQEACSRLVLSTALEPQSISGELYKAIQIGRKILANLPQQSGKVDILSELMTIGIRNVLQERGNQHGTMFTSVSALEQPIAEIIKRLVKQILLEKNAPNLTETDITQLSQWGDMYRQQFTGNRPFVGCAKACPSGSCYHQFQVKPLLDDKYLGKRLANAISNLGSTDVSLEFKAIGDIVVRRTLSPDVAKDHAEQAGLCWIIQSVESVPTMDHQLRDQITDIAVSGLRSHNNISGGNNGN